MSENRCGYAVFLFDNALEVLGEAVKPFVLEGPGGTQICCRTVDAGGAFLEMTLDGVDQHGAHAEVALLIPLGMVRMIVSSRGDDTFGFAPVATTAPHALPVVGPAAPSPLDPPAAMPHSALDDRRRPPEG